MGMPFGVMVLSTFDPEKQAPLTPSIVFLSSIHQTLSLFLLPASNMKAERQEDMPQSTLDASSPVPVRVGNFVGKRTMNYWCQITNGPSIYIDQP